MGAAIFTTSKNTATVKAMYTCLNDVLYKVDIYLYIKYTIFVGVFLSQNCEYISAIAVFLTDALKSQVYIWHKNVNMTVGSHNIDTVIKSSCQKHSGCIFASGKNAMYPDI